MYVNSLHKLSAFLLLYVMTNSSIASELGKTIYESQCGACHQINGEGIPLAGFPSLKASVMVKKQDIKDLLDMVALGSKKNPAMAGYGYDLSKEELRSVLLYIRSEFGSVQTSKLSLSLINNYDVHKNYKLKQKIANIERESRNKMLALTIKKKNLLKDKNRKEMNKLSTPGALFVKSYSYEKTDIGLAEEGYELLIRKFPESNHMLKAIDRLDVIKAIKTLNNK